MSDYAWALIDTRRDPSNVSRYVTGYHPVTGKAQFDGLQIYATKRAAKENKLPWHRVRKVTVEAA